VFPLTKARLRCLCGRGLASRRVESWRPVWSSASIDRVCAGPYRRRWCREGFRAQHRSLPSAGGVEHMPDLFTKFGGHFHAAGLTMPSNRVDNFRDRLKHLRG